MNVDILVCSAFNSFFDFKFNCDISRPMTYVHQRSTRFPMWMSLTHTPFTTIIFSCSSDSNDTRWVLLFAPIVRPQLDKMPRFYIKF